MAEKEKKEKETTIWGVLDMAGDFPKSHNHILLVLKHFLEIESILCDGCYSSTDDDSSSHIVYVFSVFLKNLGRKVRIFRRYSDFEGLQACLTSTGLPALPKKGSWTFAPVGLNSERVGMRLNGLRAWLGEIVTTLVARAKSVREAENIDRVKIFAKASEFNSVLSFLLREPRDEAPSGVDAAGSAVSPPGWAVDGEQEESTPCLVDIKLDSPVVEEKEEEEEEEEEESEFVSRQQRNGGGCEMVALSDDDVSEEESPMLRRRSAPPTEELCEKVARLERQLAEKCSEVKELRMENEMLRMQLKKYHTGK